MTPPLSEWITDPGELCALLRLPETIAADARLAVRGKRGESAPNVYPLRIPRSLLSRLRPADPKDPILLQFLPRPEELNAVPGFSADPLGEFDNAAAHSGAPSPLPDDGAGLLLRKYVGRALVLTGGDCAARCRFCFRRHCPKEKRLFPARRESSEETILPNERPASLFREIEADPTLREIILSGGDPLGLGDNELTLLFDYIMGLSFVKRVRIHSRYPVLIPERITDSLLRLFSGLRSAGKTLVVVFHLNHPAEIDDHVGRMFRRLASVGATLLSQTVLLRGINDDAQTLAALFEKEGAFSVLPYYLHQLDRVAGAAHFEVSTDRGVEIVRELRRILPGYLVPRYVREIPGAPAKTPIDDGRQSGRNGV